MRESGCYFVKVHELSAWTVAYWNKDNQRWSVFINPSHYTDDWFYEIDENRIVKE